MASAFTLYGANKDDFRLNDLIGPTIKLAILAYGYQPAVGTTGDDVWLDVAVHELPTGHGYTSSGAALTSISVTPTTNGFTFSSGSVTWNSVGAGIPEHFFYVMYVDGSLWGKASPLIGYLYASGESVGIPLTPPGTPLTVTPWAGGWFDVT
jgi:hypothetical protein